MKNTALIGILVVIIIVAGVVLLSSGNLNMKYPSMTTTTTSRLTTSTTSSTPRSTSTVSTSASSTSTSSSQTVGVKEFTVHETSNSFKITDASGATVSQIKVNKGDSVKINVIVDSGTHDFYIDGYNKATQAVTSGTQTLEFITNKAGTFDFYCRVDGHKGLGMLGQLVVSSL